MTAFRFTVYVAGRSPRARAAQRGVSRVCEQRLAAGDYEIEVVDVLVAIEAADAARILATPTLVRTHPLPVVRVVGDLSASDGLAHAIGLPEAPEQGAG